MVELQRRFPAKPQRISEIRRFVSDGCRKVWHESFDDSAISQLELAVSEATSNIILHGLDEPSNATIQLDLRVDSDQASVALLYPGREFRPHTVPPPDFTGHAESGYGLYLMQQSVDEVDFSRDDTGLCTIRLTKNRRREHRSIP
ncbi:MAG: ATP-binding protein [Planctomycetaceae bacterium]|nr:ATP-binding protein [Planctomycetaceae bacterium]